MKSSPRTGEEVGRDGGKHLGRAEVLGTLSSFSFPLSELSTNPQSPPTSKRKPRQVSKTDSRRPVGTFTLRTSISLVTCKVGSDDGRRMRTKIYEVLANSHLPHHP